MILPILVVSRFDSVERLADGGVRHVFVVQLLHLKAVRQVFEFHICVLLDGKLRVGNGFCEKRSEIEEDLQKIN